MTRTERLQERQRMQRRIRAAVAERRLARALLGEPALATEPQLDAEADPGTPA
jgi:hypothetical protein